MIHGGYKCDYIGHEDLLIPYVVLSKVNQFSARKSGNCLQSEALDLLVYFGKIISMFYSTFPALQHFFIKFHLVTFIIVSWLGGYIKN